MRDDPAHLVFDRAAATYDAVGVEFFSRFGAELVRRAGVQAGEAVLDIGTGRGAVLWPAAAAAGPRGTVVGIDLAPGMVGRTAADARDRGLDTVAVVQADAADPPLAPAAFDVALSSLVLFFLGDPAAAVRRWAQLLRPGGRLGLVTFVEDADDQRLHHVIRRFVPGAADSDRPRRPPQMALVRDPARLDGLLTAAGLTQVHGDVVRHATVFADARQWWDWAWSHGMRSAVERIPAGQHQAVIAAAAADLAGNPLPDGRLGFHVSVRYTTAVAGG